MKTFVGTKSGKGKQFPPHPEQRVSRKRRRERSIQRVLWGVTIALIVMSVVLVAWIIALSIWQPVARVTLPDKQVVIVRSREFQERVRFERARYKTLSKDDPNAGSQLADPRGFALSILHQMTREILVRDEAARRGLSVSEDEIDRMIEQAYGFVRFTPTPGPTPRAPEPSPTPPTGTPPPSPTPVTEAGYTDKYTKDLKAWTHYGLSEAGFREIIRAKLLEDKLRKAMGEDAFEFWIDQQQEDAVLLLPAWIEHVASDPPWP